MRRPTAAGTEASEEASEETGRGSRVGHRAWLPVALTMFAVAWGGNEFTPLLVMYREVGHFSAVTVDALLAAYVLGIVPALLLGGPLSDRYGRRPLLLPAAPVALAGSLVLAAGESSAALLAVGRVLCGVAIGLVMAVGTTWVKELGDATARATGVPDGGSAPRRAGLALTLGFLVGAGVAAVLAQWAHWPTHLAYVLHAALAAVAGVWVLRVPETRFPMVPDGARPARLLDDLRVPAVAHRRFLRVVVPVAPWVFGCAGSAYAVLPGLVADTADGAPIAFSGLMTVLGLGCGVGIQVLGRLIDTRRSARASVVAMVIVVLGMGLGALASARLDLPTALAAAAVLGAGYGLALVAGLSEVQRIATPDDLAGLTAVYYSLTYLGFFVPVALAALSVRWAYTQMFLGGLVVAALCLVVVACAWRAHLPTGETDVAVDAAEETDRTAPTGANGALDEARMG
ncbi:MFS transporter [Cellulosimicrobium marinum]|uniref:MFS transporter n=1 Tax=Cellulosimicrobium marinum TaxID=1638992 RepID=UPI001E5A2ACB|nr:MFS transporter [Cellulosimicrobium marinum]MCB7137444.1 MFS transporter [Cellulosimicrobium marinum]